PAAVAPSATAPIDPTPLSPSSWNGIAPLIDPLIERVAKEVADRVLAALGPTLDRLAVGAAPVAGREPVADEVDSDDVPACWSIEQDMPAELGDPGEADEMSESCGH